MMRFLSLLAICLGLAGSALAQGGPFSQTTVTAATGIVVNLIGTGSSALTLQATGGATITSTFGVSNDGVNYISISGCPQPSGSCVTGITTDGAWSFVVGGWKYFRINVTAITGTEVITIVNGPGGASTTPNGSAGANVTAAQGTPGTVAWLVSNGRAKSVLTSASATACTSLQTSAGYLVSLVNSGPATTVFLTLYDEAATPSCAAADLIYGDGTSLTIGAGQVINFPVPLTNGLAYKLSGALTSNLVIVRN